MAELDILMAYLLVLIRFTGLIVAAPVLSSRTFPPTAKIGLAAMAALVVTPVIPAPAAPLPTEILPLMLAAAEELLVGLIMGFVMNLVFSAIQIAGEITDTLTGFSVVNVFNPSLGTQAPVFAFFYYIVAVLYLTAMGGHRMMIQALVASFEKIPLGGLRLEPGLLGQQAAQWGSAMFYDGFMIAAPVAGALLLAYITMGLLGRVVPQIHLFAVGFPITIAIGLTVAAVSIRVYLAYLDGMFYRMFENVSTVLNGMS